MNIKIKHISSITALALFVGSVVYADDAKWRNLIDEDNLDNWVQMVGNAPFELKDGMIIGTAIAIRPSSFLTTKEHFGDFILEADIKVDGGLNSGIQIRSESIPTYQDGNVFGYQVEIDPSDRAWSGGIYDSSRRGWLNNMTRNPACQQAFNREGWNHYRVEANGNSMRTWVNDVSCANLLDSMTPKGFIALQIHGVGEKEAGTQSRWKNLRIMTKGLEEHWSDADETYEANHLVNQLSERQKAEGWKLLYDGKSTKGWLYTKGWSAEDGVLTGPEDNDQELVSADKYSSFELEVDFKMMEGASGGVEYLKPTKGASSKGLHYQIFDDNSFKGAPADLTTGALTGMVEARNLSEPAGGSKRFSDWNRARIVVRGDEVEHWVNDLKMASFKRNTDAFRALANYSMYGTVKGFGEAKSGHIALDGRNGMVSFRTVKIRPLAD